MYNYELEIKIDSKEELPSVDPKDGEWITEDTYQYKDLYYGFKIKDAGCTPMSSKFDDRVFIMTGTSTLEELQTMFKKLADEIVSSDTPPKLFKAGIVMLQTLLSKQDEKDFSDNLEYELSRNWPSCGIRLYLHKEPAPVLKTPEPDGYVTGSIWDVILVLKDKNTGAGFHHEDHVFCIKPESAVHEALDRMFRAYPNILERYDIITPVQVSKISKEPLKFSYLITEGDK